MKKYKPKVEWKTLAILLTPSIPLFFILVYQNPPLNNWLIGLGSCIGLLLGIFLLIYLTTAYQIKDDQFKYRSLFFFGTININDIKKLEIGKTLYVGMKPAMATKGIIIHYNKYDEVYVCAENNELLIEDFLAINPNIELQYHKKR